MSLIPKIKECMAYLNISYKETQRTVDNPLYASVVTKNKFAPLISDAGFPILTKLNSVSLNSPKSINTRSFVSRS